MFFTSLAGFSKTGHKRRLKQVADAANDSRAAIKARLKEVDAIDKQLVEIISETKHLTSSIREKLSCHLKITRNTLKSICQNLKEGVILVDYSGKILEVNGSCERSFGVAKDHIVGEMLSDLLDQLRILKTNGDELNLDEQFFRALSANVYQRISCTKNCAKCKVPVCEKTIESYFTDFNPHAEVILTVHPQCFDEPFHVAFTFSILENDPETMADVTYLLFFKIIPTNLHRRSTDK